MIQTNVAENLHLPMQSVNYFINNASNNQLRLDKKCHAELVVDSFSAGIVEMVVYDYCKFPVRNIHGILGSDVLYKFCFELSIANGTFSISRKATLCKEVFYLNTDHDNQINAILDTAASASWIANDSDLVKKLNFIRRFSLSLSFGGVSVKRHLECKMINLLMGECSFQCKRAHIGRSVIRNDCHIDLILGTDVIKKFHVSYSDGELFFHPYL